MGMIGVRMRAHGRGDDVQPSRQASAAGAWFTEASLLATPARLSLAAQLFKINLESLCTHLDDVMGGGRVEARGDLVRKQHLARGCRAQICRRFGPHSRIMGVLDAAGATQPLQQPKHSTLHLHHSNMDGWDRPLTLAGPTSISPPVTRFFWPPLMPRIMWLPTWTGGLQGVKRDIICVLARLHE